ncbi:unnamed protein product, partial [Durusdinium trenchii]
RDVPTPVELQRRPYVGGGPEGLPAMLEHFSAFITWRQTQESSLQVPKIRLWCPAEIDQEALLDAAPFPVEYQGVQHPVCRLRDAPGRVARSHVTLHAVPSNDQTGSFHFFVAGPSYAPRDSLVQAGLPRSNGPGGWVHTSRTLTHHRVDFPEDLGAETLAVLARTF